MQRSCKISESFEDYLGIFEEFYADDIEVDSETGEEPIRGKARVRSLIGTFLVPVHIIGLCVRLHTESSLELQLGRYYQLS